MQSVILDVLFFQSQICSTSRLNFHNFEKIRPLPTPAQIICVSLLKQAFFLPEAAASIFVVRNAPIRGTSSLYKTSAFERSELRHAFL